MTRKEAIFLGLRKYFNGKPCKHGHVSDRYTKNCNCKVCVNISGKLWDTLNPERAKQRHAAWRIINAKKKKEQALAWRAANREKAKSYAAAWAALNPEKNRDKSRRWSKANPEKRSAIQAIRRARENNTFVLLTKEEKESVKEIYRQCRMMSKLTGEKYHVDHIIALSRGGKHHPDNLQILTALENNRKWAK